MMPPLLPFEYPPDGWTERVQGPCPVADTDLVFIRYRNGDVYGPIKAGTRRWGRFPRQREPLPFDIIAWRLS
ncbi:MAG: hypothetical protein DI547_04885 [Sphingobium sp.]|nr:MAG: hypothetical protein DI547_04885 [Sphingobium sp.]